MKLSQKQLYFILILCSIMIFLNSMEAMVNIKDIDSYKEWKEKIEFLGNSQIENIDHKSLYLTIHMCYFFTKTLVPMTLGIYSYFAFKFIKINKIYVYIWIVLLIGNLAFTLFEFNFDSLFYYINIVCSLFLIIILLFINREIHKRWVKTDGV
ncbi:hypothetical protein [Garciella nitratireducens]|uniref:hypothetical protein n=1 Tax=Garciella nitratireducens TaxID=218205 RepID=UPI000DEA91A3|nr:hypothetical protein [Garciella nitratireducens]RBP46697.1 hypothetical protein DFR81_10189 [Garciella nitratireducens]